MGKYPGLKLRGATYYLRVEVPTDLLEALRAEEGDVAQPSDEEP